MSITEEENQWAVWVFNNATQKTVGGGSDGEVQVLTELGLMLIALRVPTLLSSRTDYAPAVKDRFIAARFFRDFADKIEAKNLLPHAEDVKGGEVLPAKPNDDLINACNGLIGLLRLVCGRNDMPAGADWESVKTNHRVIDALEVISKAQGGAAWSLRKNFP